MSARNSSAPQERRVKVLMFSVTEALAVSLFNWSNVLVAAGAFLGLLGVIGIFAMGGAKEQFANERISANERETALAKELTAKAELRTEALRWAMMPKMFPTTGGGDPELEAKYNALKAFSGTKVLMLMTEQSATLASQISSALTAAGWSVTPQYMPDVVTREGVHVYSGPWQPDVPEKKDRAWEAAEALNQLINLVRRKLWHQPIQSIHMSQKLLPQIGPFKRPESEIVVTVGRPDTYFELMLMGDK
jgi:hypothetical protein